MRTLRTSLSLGATSTVAMKSFANANRSPRPAMMTLLRFSSPRTLTMSSAPPVPIAARSCSSAAAISPARACRSA